jgi:hypothetical protein
MSLGVISPIRNKGLYSDWLSAAPLATSMLTIDTSGNVGSQAIPVAAWGSITGTLSNQTDLQNALNAKLSLSGGTMTGAITGTSNIVEFASSTSSQTVRLYNTFTDTSNYIRQSLSFTTYSSTVHAQLAAEGAGTGAVNVPFVITPRGTGAFIVGPMPDGTTTGGNARGANAVDLQTSRNSASQVASGTRSVILGGTNNTASGQRSLVFGSGSTASGGACFAFGDFCTASGDQSFAVGYASTASAASSCAFGNASATALLAFAHGAGSASRVNQYAHAYNANYQYVRFVVYGAITGSTPTTLMLDGSSTRLTIPSGKVFMFEAKIVGVKSDGSAAATYYRKGCIENVGGTTALVGTIETIGTDYEDNASTNVVITADNTNDALDISVTGIAAETWRWVAVVEGVEVAYGT